MTIHDRQEFIIFDVPQPMSEVDFAHETEEIEKLPKSHIRCQRSNLGQYRQRFLLKVWSHGSRSPIFGSAANARDSLPITSTWINWPGASFAMRVARVTPLNRIKKPSVPS